jgi:hypothetical protein
MRALLLVSLVAAGCASDVCGGVNGVCIAARVEGSVGQLDQLQIDLTFNGASSTRMSPQGTNMPFNLPVKLAIEASMVPSSAPSVQIGITGIRGGLPVTQTQIHSVAVINNRGSDTFNLAPLVGDMSIDLAKPPDLSGVPIVVTPTSYTFTQPVATGQMTGERAVFVATNNTNEIVFVGPDPGDMSSTSMMMDKSFSPDPSFGTPQGPCSIDPSLMGFNLQPMRTCTIAFAFTPTNAGPHSLSVTVHPRGQSSGMIYNPPITLMLSGNAMPAWTTDPGPNSLNAVWGSSPMDIYAVGNNATGGIFHSIGDGNWSQLATPSTVNSNNLFSITAQSSTMLWFGGYDNAAAGAIIIGARMTTSGLVFNTESFPTFDPTTVRAMAYDMVNNTPVGLSDKSFLIRDASGNWNPDATMPGSGTGAWSMTPVSVINGQGAYTRAGGAWVALASPASVDLGMTTGGTTLRGIWGDGNDTFIVGQQGLIWHYLSGSTIPNVEKCPNITNDFLAVTARRVGTNIEAWAVGFLGNQICHRTPTDNAWHNEMLPSGGALRGVWVDPPTGVVVGVGDSILRFH